MAIHGGGPLNFDEWVRLAQSNPTAFEARREVALSSYIEQQPQGQRLRLRRLQWRVDRERERAANPVASCLALYTMMWDSLVGDGGLLESCSGEASPAVSPDRKSAAVLPFVR